MELPAGGIYCVAKSNENVGMVEATAHLPYPIDLSKADGEIAVKYIAVTPTWNHLKDLHMEIMDELDESDEPINIHLIDLVDTDQEIVILNLRQQLESQFRRQKDPPVKILKSRLNKVTYECVIRKSTSVRFSPELSKLLGLTAEVFQSSPTDKLVVPIVYRIEEKTSTTDIYYLKSEEIASSFMIDSKQDRILELLHIPGTETVDFHPALFYSMLEVSPLEKLTFTLYNEQNKLIFSDKPDLYIVCHVRRAVP